MVLKFTVTPNRNTVAIPNKFVQRKINVTFQLAPASAGQPSPKFTGTQSNQVTISGLRLSAKIVKAGGRSMGTAQLQIYGMTLQLMNDLSTLGIRIQMVPRNGLIVTAGDNDGGMATVFQGNITSAWADFQSAPDVPFHVEAHTGLPQAVINVPASSYQGSTDVATIMSSLATLAGLAFENNNVQQKINCPYLPGSARDQIAKLAKDAGINWFIDSGTTNNAGTLIIWPKNGSRGGQIPLISPETGMVGYPCYTAMGIIVKTLFNPAIGYGGQIKVQSSLTPANGTWAVYGLDHDLDAQVPNGQWFSTILAYNPKFNPPILG